MKPDFFFFWEGEGRRESRKVGRVLSGRWEGKGEASMYYFSVYPVFLFRECPTPKPSHPNAFFRGGKGGRRRGGMAP